MHRASSIVGEVKGQGQGQAKGQNQGRADGQIHLVASHLIVTETSNFIHILIYEKQHQIWPGPWFLALTS